MPFSAFDPGIYELQVQETLSDISAEGVLLRHKKSGARIALVLCEDENRVFSVTFRTPPLDSSGAAHIVEHTVLCGSEKYPLKDPFITLVKGSLNTYLNASTYPDMTMYPVASTNEKDFRNLMDVYLDGVFHPLIAKDRRIFEKEGWSLRLSDPAGPLTVSGVVYNEMKGAFSSPEEILEREIAATLFPDTPYGLESGGDPDSIPDLTYEQFLSFYRTYYHPSNAYIYIYGKLDYGEILSYLDRDYLSSFETAPVNSAIPLQKPFDSVRHTTAFYPAVNDGEEEENETRFSYSVTAGSPFDVKRMIAMDVIDYALFSMPGAPVRQALLDEGFGEDVYGSFEDGIAQPYFSVVVKGADPDKADAFPDALMNAVRDAKEDLNPAALLAGISAMLFSYREADYGSYPKGLIYGIDMLETWLFDDRRPFDALMRGRVYEQLRSEAEQGTGYFENVLEECFLSNPHAACVTLCPEMGLLEKTEQAREEHLAAMLDTFSEEKKAQIITHTRELLAYQETEDPPEAAACLPSLELSDIRQEARTLSNEEENLSKDLREKGNRAVWHRVAGNGIGYFTLYFPLRDLTDEGLFYASLLRDILFGVDTKGHTYQDLSYAIDTHTGGLSAGLIALRQGKSAPLSAFLTIHGRALYEEMEVLFLLLNEVLTSSDLAMRARIREIVMKRSLQMSTRIPASGNYYALIRAASRVSEGAALHEAAGGIAFYDRLRRLTDSYDASFEAFSSELSEYAKRTLCGENVQISLTCGEEESTVLLARLQDLLRALPECAAECAAGIPGFHAARSMEAIVTGGQVQHVAMAGTLPKETEFDGIFYVIRHIFSYGYLWEKIRDQGNAYGCGISFARNGTVSMSSFRDPNLSETLDVFRGLPEALSSFQASAEDMKKYIIGTVSALDTPMQPAAYGDFCMQAYLSRLTQEDLNRERAAVLNACAGRIADCGAAALEAVRNASICVIGSKEKIDHEKDIFDAVRLL